MASPAANSAAAALESLGERYGAWWMDALGEHNHVGGAEATGWLLERSGLLAGDFMLDAGAFVGGAARLAASTGVRAIATDMNADFLSAGRTFEHGEAVTWIEAVSEKLPFATETFASVWALDAATPPRELSRVAAPSASLCLCCEAPVDSRGGAEAFVDEWGEYGWRLAAHRALTLEATATWRRAEGELVWRRPYYEQRYGKRSYLAQLDLLTSMVQTYERGEVGHGLYVFRRQTQDI